MITMKNWQVQMQNPQDARIGYQGENLSRTLKILVDVPGNWQYKLDLCNQEGKANVLALEKQEDVLSVELTRAHLAVSGLCRAQVRGLDGERECRSNIFYLDIGPSINALDAFEPLEPDEFAQMEQTLTAHAATAHNAATQASASAGQAAASAGQAEQAAMLAQPPIRTAVYRHGARKARTVRRVRREKKATRVIRVNRVQTAGMARTAPTVSTVRMVQTVHRSPSVRDTIPSKHCCKRTRPVQRVKPMLWVRPKTTPSITGRLNLPPGRISDSSKVRRAIPARPVRGDHRVKKAIRVNRAPKARKVIPVRKEKRETRVIRVPRVTKVIRETQARTAGMAWVLIRQRSRLASRAPSKRLTPRLQR